MGTPSGNWKRGRDRAGDQLCSKAAEAEAPAREEGEEEQIGNGGEGRDGEGRE